jgi:multidrug efflux pump subunit AcrA (membrane-fusion protein)
MRKILLVWAAVALIGCGKKQEAAKEEEAAAPVEAAKAEKTTIHRVVEADAVLYPVDQANITAKISAPVKKFNVNRGDHVTAGQVLAVLEDRDLQAALAENRQLVAQAQAAFAAATGAQMPEELTRAQADLTAQQQTVEAAKKVYESRVELQKQGALAQKLVDDARVTMVQAQSQLENARQHLKSLETVGRTEQVKNMQAQLDAAKARYDNAAAQLSYAEIRSPISGVVSDRPLYAGEMAQSGTPIVSVVQITSVIARANIPVKEASDIKVGMPARMTGAGGELSGRVTVVSPAVDPNTTTVEVWVQAGNPGEKLKPGTSVHVAIEAQDIKDAIVVPAAALLAFDEGGEKVMVVGTDSLAHEHKVEVGVREGDKVQILSGVAEGEQVITVGGLGLDDKAKVTLGKPDGDK